MNQIRRSQQRAATKFPLPRWPSAIAFFTVLTLLCIACTSAPAETSSPPPGQPYPLSAFQGGADENENLALELVDGERGEGLPRKDLGREEATELAEAIFGDLFESAAGPFGELRIRRFLSDHAAIVRPVSLDAAATPGGKEAVEEEAEHMHGPLLLESTLPLRAENDSGEERLVDLDLEGTDAGLQAANPLIDVEIPSELKDGIDLPSGTVELATEPSVGERKPSILGKNVAFYPNVATDTDFAIASTPTGVETYTQLRSADAPQSQTLHLDLAGDNVLQATPDGGAVVMSGQEEAAKILAPVAVDANGSNVPASLEVAGNSLVLHASPQLTTKYPVLVDPVIIESWPWYKDKTKVGLDNGNGSGTGAWRSWRNTYAYGADNHVPWGSAPSPLVKDLPGLTVTSGWNASVAVGAQANWNYYVPRYFADYEKYGTRPTSFIQNMQMWNLQYHTYSSQSSPWMAVGIWDEQQGKWVSYYTRNGTQGSITDKYWNLVYNFPNPNYVQSAKNAGFGLLSSEAGANNGRILYAGYAALSLNDLTNPQIGEFYGPEGWSDEDPIEPITVAASDSGLGVKALTAEPEEVKSPPQWKAIGPECMGTAADPCPRTFTFDEGTAANGPDGGVYYNPDVMPQGVNYVKVTAEDVLGNKSSAALVQVKVDHSTPELTISGPLSEVAAVGESWPSYRLDISANDGTKYAPQSGITKTTVKIDGEVVSESAPGCESGSCSVNRSWTLEADEVGAGKHTLEVIAFDGVGRSVAKTRTFKLSSAPAPDIALAGSLTEQDALGIERPRYALAVEASTEAGQKYKAPAPIATFAFGKGELEAPEDIALDSTGHLWVPYGNAIKEYDAGGNFVKQIGEYSYKGCGLNTVYDVAIDSSDYIWAANGNGRVAKYNKQGECLLSFGGSEAGQGSIGHATCIGIDGGGNVWVCDWEGNYISKFTASGKFLAKVGTSGTGEGEISSPLDIAFGPGGEAWVSDTNRVLKFSANGKFMSQIDEAGWGNGELYGASGLATDIEGNLFVVATTKNRIEEFNSDGEYRSHFGHYGTGLGQFYWPEGIAIDSSGNFWVADTNNNRITRWVAPPRPLDRVLQVGGTGNGEGEFSAPAGIATDAEGNHWVADTGNDRIQKFGPEGEYLDQFGESGSEEGQLDEPHDIAIDGEGNLWVTDSGNGRVEHFTPEGEYLGEVEQPYKGMWGLTYPTGIVIDAEETIWVADADENKVERFGPEGEWYFEWIGEAGSGSGQLNEPYGLDVDQENNLWVADAGNNRIEKFAEWGEYLGEIGDEGSGLGTLYRPTDVSVDLDGNLWATSSEAWAVEEFSPQGDYLNQIGWGKYPGELEEPTGIVADADGKVWVTDTAGDDLQAWSLESTPASLSLSVGTTGTGEGQLDAPTGIATDAEGNHWVADTGNDRIQKFGPEGEYLDQFGESGSEEGQLDEPRGIAIDAEDNLWIASSGSGRVEHFTPEGEYLGELERWEGFNLQYPTGIAIDSYETIWVADTAKGMVERYGPEGEWFWEWVGKPGTGKGQLSAPVGVAIDSKDHVLVADTGNHRIQEFSEAGTVLREFGQSGTGALDNPGAIALGPEGNVWATDADNGRVKGFDQNRQYVGQFGGEDAESKLASPAGLAASTDGRIWVTDADTDRIQAWTPSPSNGSTSEIAVDIGVDGKQVLETSASCAAANCEVAPEWMLDSSTLSEGEHEVEIQTIDAYGRTTTETLPIELEADDVKPAIDAGGDLFDAPEGWVEQEGYGLNATASDAGYGVTSFVLEIDGEPIASTGKSCVDGGCTASLSQSIDMGPYTGGAHEADLIATDGAGNISSKGWTINVDPDGQISTKEALQTLEAVDATSDSTTVASTTELVDLAEIEEGNDPKLVVEGASLESAGTGADSIVENDASEGFTIDSGVESFHIEPTTNGSGETDIEIANEVSGVAANTADDVDTVIRPIYDGLMEFKTIRTSSAPEEYSWTVQLHQEQVLKVIDEEHAGIYFPDETLALTITVQEAHDATGKVVPTSLNVSEEHVLTLTVDHKNSGFVYPVIAGPTWQTGYETIVVAGPPTKQEEEEAEAEELIQGESIYMTVSAPQSTGCPDPEEACASSSSPYRTYGFWACSPSPVFSCSVWEERIRGFFYYNYSQAWQSKRQPKCLHKAAPSFSVDEDYCKWVGPDHQPYKNGYHITSQVRYGVTSLQVQTTSQKFLTVRMYGSGNPYVTSSPNICNPSKPSCA